MPRKRIADSQREKISVKEGIFSPFYLVLGEPSFRLMRFAVEVNKIPFLVDVNLYTEKIAERIQNRYFQGGNELWELQ